AGAVRAVLGARQRAQLLVEQRGEPAVGHQHDVAAAPAVAAVGAAARHELLAPEADAAVAAAARDDLDHGLVDEGVGGIHASGPGTPGSETEPGRRSATRPASAPRGR